MKLVYIVHPLTPGPEELESMGPEVARGFSIARGQRWRGWAGLCGFAPMVPWIAPGETWEETPENRERGLAIDLAIIERCDEVWLCGGRISPGMQIRAEYARKLVRFDMIRGEDLLAGPWVRNLTSFGSEPPADLGAIARTERRDEELVRMELGALDDESTTEAACRWINSRHDGEFGSPWGQRPDKRQLYTAEAVLFPSVWSRERCMAQAAEVARGEREKREGRS